MSHYTYSVVIVTYNRLDLLKECLEHCFAQTIPFDEVVVVDNHSSDGTGDYLDSLSPSQHNLKVFHMDDNLGGAGGFYTGLDLVSKECDYILLIDDDAIINYDYIEKIEPYITDDILAYSGTVDVPGSPAPRQRHMLSDPTFLFIRPVSREMYDGEYFDYDLSSFCGLLISSELVTRYGLPEKDYYIWHDDIEYSMRLGHSTVFRNINAAHLTHRISTNTSAHRYGWKSYYGGRNSWDVALKYSKHPLFYHICRILYHSAGTVYRLILAISPRERDYNLKVSKMHRDILKFAFDRKLGRHPDYTPENGFS